MAMTYRAISRSAVGCPQRHYLTAKNINSRRQKSGGVAYVILLAPIIALLMTGPDRGLDRKGLSVRAPAQHGMPTFGLAVGKSLVTD